MVTSITYDLKKKAPIRLLDDRSADEGLLDPIKCLRTLISKNKWVSLAKRKVRALAIFEKFLIKRR